MSKRDFTLRRDYAEELAATVPIQTTSTSAVGGPVTGHGHTSAGDGGVLDAYAGLVDVPEYAYSACTPGQIAYDDEYVYICIDTNTWMRAGIATWGSAPSLDFSTAGNSMYVSLL